MSGISFDNYGIADWKWEFLRRNSRYQKAYRAVEWLKKRARRENVSPFFKGFGLLEPIHFLNLANRLQERLHLGHPPLKNVSQQLKKDSQQPGEWVGSLPSPQRAAHEFQYSPVQLFPIIALYDQKDFGEHYSGHRHDEEPGQLTAREHQVIVVFDTRCKWEEISSALKQELEPHLSKRRNQILKYRDYLAVWDLWQKNYSADEIAPKLWPEEDETKGGRDVDTGEKGSLLQRVYDHKNAVEELIDEAFPPCNRRNTQLKK